MLLFPLALPVTVAVGDFDTVEGMQGFAVPTGTSIVASSTSTAYKSDLAVDKDITTAWHPGSKSGNIQLTFPKNMAISFIQLASNAKPAVKVQ